MLPFPFVLSSLARDNGSEFSNPKVIEEPDMLSGLKTRIFYCDAGKPYPKGAIEVNHELIRRILPKGANFDQLTQDDINRMMNHINSYKRKKLNNRSPYETFRSSENRPPFGMQLYKYNTTFFSKNQTASRLQK